MVEHGRCSFRGALSGKGNTTEIEIWSRGTIGNSGIHMEKRLASFERKMTQTMRGNDAGQARDDGAKMTLVDLEDLSDLQSLKNLFFTFKNEVE